MEQHVGVSMVNYLRFAFLATLLAGTLGILTGWWLQSFPLTFCLPLVFMGAYLGLGLKKDWRNSISNTQFADSIYYLGFLFTLIALTVSLFILNFQQGNALDDLMWRFGLALVTTVVGLSARICLTSFHASFEDSLANAEEALERASQSLRQQLHRMSADMVAQNEAMKTALQHALDTSRSALVDAMGAVKVTLSQASKELSDTISSNVREQERASQSLRQQLHRISADMVAHNEAMKTALQHALDTSQSALVDAMGAVKVTLSQASKELSDTISSNMREHLEEQATDLARLRSDAQERLQVVSALREKLGREIEQAQDSLSQMCTQLVKTALQHALNTSQSALADAMGAVKVTLSQASKELSDTISSNMREHLEGQATDLARLRSDAQEHLQAVSALREKLGHEVEQAQDSLSQMHTQLVKTANFIAGQLGDGSK